MSSKQEEIKKELGEESYRDWLFDTRYLAKTGNGTGGSYKMGTREITPEVRYAITWASSKEQLFEVPTGGAAIMREGENLLYFARKEQCLALATQLRTFKITKYQIYLLRKNAEVQLLHPKDGVFPEKSNEGRVRVNGKDFSIGKNPNPSERKFSGKPTFE